ncbi:MAG: thioesterase [Corynebacteriales bacterium]|nr:thioesterase [Mycobacteriales bacterium]
MADSATSIALWLRKYHEARQGAPQLVVFPHAGGSASFYTPLSRALSPQLDVYAVQYPGRQDRRNEPFIPTMRDLADTIAPILTDFSTGPLTLYGHSLGAILAFEVAVRLSPNVSIAHLFASGARPPAAHRRGTLHLQSDAAVLAEVREMSGTQASLLDDKEVQQMVLPALRNDYQISETYEYTQHDALPCAITTFSGSEDPKIDAHSMSDWARHTTDQHSEHTFPGGHFFITEHWARVASIIRQQSIKNQR